jgi:hypothetical protein
MAVAKWSDDGGVAKWVNEVLDERELEEERQFAMRYVNCDVPGPSVGYVFRQAESEAAARARLGDYKLLERLLRPDSPLVKWFHGAGLKPLPFGPETWTLIADRITGKFKLPRGKPPEDTKQWLDSPVHLAAVEVEDVENVLRTHYAAEHGIRERAITIAAERGKIRREKLEHYLRSRRYLEWRRNGHQRPS